MKQFLLFNEQGSCYKCLCELFNIFWCFRFENWYDNSVSINSIFIDKIDSPNSKIDNYRLLTPYCFIDCYRISKKLIDFYRLLSNAIDYRWSVEWPPRVYLNVVVHAQVCRLFCHQCKSHCSAWFSLVTLLITNIFAVNQIIRYNGVLAITKTSL